MLTFELTDPAFALAVAVETVGVGAGDDVVALEIRVVRVRIIAKSCDYEIL